jgi:hypothetical protein
MDKDIIVPMETQYPFGSITSALEEGTNVLVVKELPFENSE